MSAYGYKQTSRGQFANVCFTPESGHSFRDSASAATITCQNTFQCKKSSTTRVAHYRLRESQDKLSSLDRGLIIAEPGAGDECVYVALRRSARS